MFSSHSVQIAALFSDVFGQALPNLCRSFYNETKAGMFFSVFAVALLAEGVDRNCSAMSGLYALTRSPSSRRAWIEMGSTRSAWDWQRPSPSSRRAWIEILVNHKHTHSGAVALLAEGVDRNEFILTIQRSEVKSPSSRRAWIEISCWQCRCRGCCCRPPRGGRG